MPNCPYCPNQVSIPGRACESCQADWDQALGDLFNVIEKMSGEAKVKAFDMAVRLFGER